MENPTQSLFLLIYANGGDPLRVPMISVPLLSIFSRVFCAWPSVSEGYEKVGDREDR